MDKTALESNSEKCFQTYTGKKFYLFDPEPESICIEDIAHALSMKCRFGGHSTQFYSVAQHSILVSLCLEIRGASDREQSDMLPLFGLLHDAAEAYIPDFIGTVKHSFGAVNNGTVWTIKALEHTINTAIFNHLNIPMPNGDDTKRVENADLSVLITEAEQVTFKSFEWVSLPGIEPFSFKISPWTPGLSEERFLHFYHRLTRLMEEKIKCP